MSIRLRLALWYGTLFAAALLTVSFVSYGVFSRSQYVAQDQLLVLSVHNVAAGVLASGHSYILDAQPDGSGLLLRLYNPEDRLTRTSPGAERVPPSSPSRALATPAGPAYDRAARLVPSLRPDPQPAGNAAFGLFRLGGERWRRYVLRLERGGRVLGYVEGLTSLGTLDRAVAELGRLLLALGSLSLLVVVGLGWAIAGRALGPVARLNATARHITQSHDLSRRVGPTSQRDELGRLAATFNEMLDSLERSAQAQRRFVFDASHELRAPLTVMQGNLELLRRHPTMPPSERDEVLGEVERETARLARLVADLLLLARRDAGVPFRRTRVDLGTVALEAFRDAGRLARGQVLRHEPGSGLFVLGDRDRLKQLILILLDNALKYTPDGQPVELCLEASATGVSVVVRDEGTGIPPADLPHVFERFYRADPARARDPGGTGLGLPIAAWIVEQHGGRISLTSEPGQGTRVEVFLDRDPGAGPSEGPGEGSA